MQRRWKGPFSGKTVPTEAPEKVNKGFYPDFKQLDFVFERVP